MGPDSAAADAPKTDARFVLVTGARNRAYLPQSQRATFAYLDKHQPARHSLVVLPTYSHTDVFIGARAHSQVFPRLVAELSR